MKKIFLIITFLNSMLFASSEVGLLDKKPKIINGTQVSSSDESWKFIVSLQWNEEHYCGGSLIAPNWILTAAHCLSDNEGNPYASGVGDSVGVGSYNLFNMRQYSIKRFIVHPSFNLSTMDNDIGLIELRVPVYHMTSIDYDTGSSLSVNTPTKVAGWGTMTDGMLDSPNNLMEALTPIVDFNRCDSAYKGKLTRNMLCAGYFTTTRDSCQGDSGGPLMVNGTLLGIVSFGNGCASWGYPGVYTKVQNYTSWIRRYVPKVTKWAPVMMGDITTFVPY